MKKGLRIDRLSYAYSNAQILSDISFDMGPGRLLGILGPNGSGKTTLLRCLSGFCRVEQGMITLNGRDISAYSAKELSRSMALVPQHALMEFDFTVRDIVLMGRHPHHTLFEPDSQDDYKRVDAAMERTGISLLADRSVLTLSGGEWQRTIISRAICQQSDILLLDEPVSNLDIRYQIEILNLVRGLCRREGVMAIAVLHDMNLASHYCDDLALIHNGAVFAYGRPEQVITPERIKDVFGINVRVREEYGRPFVIPEYY